MRRVLLFRKGQPGGNERYTKLWYLNKWMMNTSPSSRAFAAIPHYGVIITRRAAAHTHTQKEREKIKRRERGKEKKERKGPQQARIKTCG